MYGVLSSLKLEKLFEVAEVKTDNLMLRLHYIASVIILVSYSAIITVNTYAGDPIDCKTSHRNAPSSDFIDSYCYIHGTKPLQWNTQPHNKQVDIVDPPVNCEGDECERTHKYYQWVAVVAVLQAGLFYLPYFIWYGWEGGRLGRMIGSLSKQPKLFVDTNQDCSSIIHMAEDYHLTSSGCNRTQNLARQFVSFLGENRLYVLKFTLVEVFALIVAYSQLIITDSFIGGALSKHGLSIFNDLLEVESKRTDKLEWALPITSRCVYKQYGAANRDEEINSICVLPNNVVHQKFFVFWGFWLLMVVVYTSVHMLVRLVLIVLPSARAALAKTIWAECESKTGSKLVLNYIYQNISYADWLVLSQIHANLGSYNFMLFLDDLSYQYYQVNESSPEFVAQVLKNIDQQTKTVV